MEINLSSKPKGPTIIQGFPGFGMVGAIAIEYLIEHLDTKKIGKITYEHMPPMAALHDGKLIEPLGIYYNKKYNLILIHSIMAPPGSEWDISKGIAQLAKDVQAKQIICLEGVSGNNKKETNVLSYSNSDVTQKALNKLGYDTLTEGVILGITASVLLSGSKNIACLFAEAHANMPDSSAAAKLIEALDKYLKLKVDYKPLEVTAAKFEEKLRSIMQQSKQAEDVRDKKTLSYVG